MAGRLLLAALVSLAGKYHTLSLLRPDRREHEGPPGTTGRAVRSSRSMSKESCQAREGTSRGEAGRGGRGSKGSRRGRSSAWFPRSALAGLWPDSESFR